jgi:hypothetical protein
MFLEPMFEPKMVDESYEFKLGRSAHLAAARWIDLPGFTLKKLKKISFALQNIFSKSVGMGLRWHQMHLCIKEKEHLSC